MDNVAREGYEVGDIFVAVVEVASNIVGGGEEDQRACGDRLCGIPHVGVEKHVVGTTELLDAEVVVVDEALKGFYALLHRTHFDAAPHTVEGHRDHGVTELPTDGAVFGIVGNRPNTCLSLDEGLIAIVIIFMRNNLISHFYSF